MIIAIVVALLVMPLIVLRGRTLASFYGSGVALAALALLAARRIELDEDRTYLAIVALAVAELALFTLFLARGANVRWSANRGALIAAIVYALAVPAMLRAPIDGDEPFYLLITESLVHDRDFDLANQYANLNVSETGRDDLVPQSGDPVGKNGERYSRHEPFLAILMIPGYLLAGLHGALATIALFGALLVRSTLRWMEDERIDAATIRAVFPFFALAPPVLFYAARIWPEVPAAFFFVEALRGVRGRRMQRWLPALAGLVLLKLRFVLLAIPLAFSLKRRAALVALLIGAAMLVLYLISGSALSVHSLQELQPGQPIAYVRGLLGLLVDGQAGMLFRAPFLLLGVLALFRWRHTPEGFRLGVVASTLYILYLVPRSEWHGGWSPPLRYIVFLTPVLALGAAAIWPRISREVIAVMSLSTIALAIHGLTYPWRLFTIASGENTVGAWLSSMYESDFSRVFPSFIRVNDAAWIASALLIVILLLARFRAPVATILVTLVIVVALRVAQSPGTRIEFEDAHIVHRGGELYPPEYTEARFYYRSGWLLHAGEEMSFLAAAGTYDLEGLTGIGAMIEIAGRAYHLSPGEQYTRTRVVVERGGRVTLRCVSGAVNLDRMSQ